MSSNAVIPSRGQTLRPYQAAGKQSILDAWRSGALRVLAIAPTGSGKTSLFTTIAAEEKTGVLILVHRRELAEQAAARLREFGIDFGFIARGMPKRPFAKVQIAMVQTLMRRKHRPEAGLIICDEAHLSTADSWSGILSHYPHSRLLGVTATPWRLSGAPLVGTYDASVVISTPAALREEGFLCPYAGFSYKAPDLEGIGKVGDDYNKKQTGEAMRAPGIVANIVEQWQKHASHLSTVVFAVTVEHSKELTAKFIAAGVRAEHVDGSTSVEARKATLARVESGETRVLCNVGIAVEGLDIPRLKCCILARPTMSLARAIQMMGRVRRPWGGLAARIHDHAFVIRAHGLPDAERDYTLSSEAPAPGGSDTVELTVCAQCLAWYPSGGKCPECGQEPVAKPRAGIEEIEGAEEFEFSSDDSPTGVVLPAVQIAWSDPGRVIEGRYERSFEDNTQWGMSKRYMVQGTTGTKRKYVLPGTTQLDRLMRKVSPGMKIRVTFTGTTTLGDSGKVRKEFKVEKDDERVCVVEGCGKTFKQNTTQKACSEDCKKKLRCINTANYRARHPEKIAKSNVDWREKNAEKAAKYEAEYYAKNAETIREKAARRMAEKRAHKKAQLTEQPQEAASP